MKCTSAVILAGGKGTRLMPLTKDIPKPMVGVNGKPFLYWQIAYLREQGVNDVLLLVSHLAHVIVDHFSREPVRGVNVRYCTEATPMGTGGALYNARKDLPESFWLINGDSFLYIDLDEMEKHHERMGWEATLATAATEMVPVPGNLKISGDKILAYRKEAGKAAGFPFVDAGVYLMRRCTVERGPQGVFDLGAYWPPLIENGRLGSFSVNERFFDIGTVERLKTFEDNIGRYVGVKPSERV